MASREEKRRREEREDKEGRGGGGEQPKKGRGFKGSDRKALVSVWWFGETLRPVDY